jgi:putative endopeptidase
MDFYRYANGRWLESARIPDNRSRWGTFDQIDERNQDTLGAALDRALKGTLPPRGTAQRVAIEFYASGKAIARTSGSPASVSPGSGSDAGKELWKRR